MRPDYRASRSTHGRTRAAAGASGERTTKLTGRAGRLSYYVAGAGAPLLLVHSINAAGSAYEVRPIFERLRIARRDYAVDLPGLRLLRPHRPRATTSALYVAAIHDMLDAIAADVGAGPVDALAISLGSEFLARAATERPERLRTLALVTPTGFSPRLRSCDGPRRGTREVPGLYRFFTVPLWSQAFYDLLVSRRSIRYFLQTTFGSKTDRRGSAGLRLPDRASAGRQERALCFRLGTAVQPATSAPSTSAWSMPVWVPHATRGDFKDFSDAGWTASRPNWRCSPTMPAPCRISNGPGVHGGLRAVPRHAGRLSRVVVRPSRDRPARSGAA